MLFDLDQVGGHFFDKFLEIRKYNMPRNKNQRRRGILPSITAASAVQTELIQVSVTYSQSSTDVGPEAARQINEKNKPSMTYIAKSVDELLQ